MAIDPPRKERTHEEDLRIGGTDYSGYPSNLAACHSFALFHIKHCRFKSREDRNVARLLGPVILLRERTLLTSPYGICSTRRRSEKVLGQTTSLWCSTMVTFM